MPISQLWNLFFFKPMLNGMLFLYDVTGHNFAISIALFTIAVRLITLPLTLPQQRSAKKMQAIQPQLKELQKKYKDNKEKLTQAQMELYKEAGVNPLGGCLPMLIQFPVWIALYQAIQMAMSSSPLSLVKLAKNIYPALPNLARIVPLNPYFLTMDLGHPPQGDVFPANVLGYGLVILVAATMWIQQKMMTTPGADPQSAQMNQTMQMTMPLVFGFMSLQFPLGLSLYFVVSNVVGIVTQYFISGWGDLAKWRELLPGRTPTQAKPSPKVPVAAAESAPATTGAQKGKRRGGRKKKKRGR